MNETDLRHLQRCVELARQAVDEGDEPLGSVLVGGDGAVVTEDRNRALSLEATRHPSSSWLAGPVPS